MTDVPNAWLSEQPHRRYNALTGKWVFVSPHRLLRPWQGRQEPRAALDRAHYDPTCYLCPGNVRANGEHNPKYPGTYVFDNDFSAFLPDIEPGEAALHPLLRAQREAGVCRVICFSPRHDLTLAHMSMPEIRGVVDTWAAQVEDLGRRWRWVQIFENNGELMGCSNPHPHGQIWASGFLPDEPAAELAMQHQWHATHGSPLLVDYTKLESSAQERIVAQNDHWLAVVPWWAIWPFEILLMPRRHVLRLPDLTVPERDGLADVLRRLLGGYDVLFDTSCPYSLGWHGAPTDGGDYDAWQLHAHVYPPLLRSATVRKFMVGYELLAEPQRDLTPERSAKALGAAIQSVASGA